MKLITRKKKIFIAKNLEVILWKIFEKTNMPSDDFSIVLKCFDNIIDTSLGPHYGYCIYKTVNEKATEYMKNKEK